MEYASTVIPVLRKIRDMVVPEWGTAKVANTKGGSDRNIVTLLDTQVEEFVSGDLAKLFPDIAFVGEEGGGNREHESFWLMDPIDGTQSFVRGLPFCTSMLALVRSGEVIFSAIYDFLNDRMYFAENGKGAFCNDRPIHVSDLGLSRAFIGWEANHRKEENRAMTWKMRERAALMNTQSAGWDYIMVADGKLEGRICFDPYGFDYDFAPGCFLVKEAGGMVANIGSAKYDYRNTSVIAANPIVFKELTEGENALFPITK